MIDEERLKDIKERAEWYEKSNMRGESPRPLIAEIPGLVDEIHRLRAEQTPNDADLVAALTAMTKYGEKLRDRVTLLEGALLDVAEHAEDCPFDGKANFKIPISERIRICTCPAWEALRGKP